MKPVASSKICKGFGAFCETTGALFEFMVFILEEAGYR
jgi:hypothetical protein